jgi:hypothetical protein
MNIWEQYYSCGRFLLAPEPPNRSVSVENAVAEYGYAAQALMSRTHNVALRRTYNEALLNTLSRASFLQQ